MNSTKQYRDEVENAFKNGKKILRSYKDKNIWVRDENPIWYWNGFDYKIDPMPDMVLPHMNTICWQMNPTGTTNDGLELLYCYDNLTYVIYMFIRADGKFKSSMPLYNADGSLRLWKNENDQNLSW